MKKIFSIIVIFSFVLSFHHADGRDSETPKGWKAGVARVVITPDQPMWMAGYGNRDHPSEGTLHDLWAKALVLEDKSGKQVVLVTTDLLGIPTNLSNRIRNRLKEKFLLSREQIILNSSHTHTGPVLENALPDLYPLDSLQLKKIKDYSDKLETAIVTLVGEAIGSMKPAQLYAQNGITRFQVNRRNNNETLLNAQTVLNGPNDYAVPVIKVLNESDELMAVAFGYACHATVLNSYKWSGDYPGFAQLELEKMHPGVTALFFQGAGADINPLPRRSVALAHQYGRELAAAVERVLDEDMRQLPAHISTAYSEIQLSLSSLPTKDELLKMSQHSQDHVKRWAARLLKLADQGKPLTKSYPYPVQIWQFGDQMIVGLGGELVVDYARELKNIFGQNIFVLGYCNDVMAYIPSASILREGGYEGASSQFVYGLAAIWKADIEILILKEVLKLAGEIGIPLQDSVHGKN